MAGLSPALLPGPTINAFAGASIPVLIVGGLFTGLGFAAGELSRRGADPRPVLVQRVEGTVASRAPSARSWASSPRSVRDSPAPLWDSSTVAGYDGAAETQAPAANSAIVALYSWFPLALFAGVFVVMMVYGRFDRLILPQAQAELEARGETAHHATELSPTPPVIVGGSVGVDAHAELAAPRRRAPRRRGRGRDRRRQEGLNRIPRPARSGRLTASATTPRP